MARSYKPRFGELSKLCLLAVADRGFEATRSEVVADLVGRGELDGSIHKALNNSRIFTVDRTVEPPTYSPTNLGYVVLGEYLAGCPAIQRAAVYRSLIS